MRIRRGNHEPRTGDPSQRPRPIVRRNRTDPLRDLLMPAQTIFRVHGIQMEPKLGRLGDNLERILGGLDEAARSGARLAVFPECALSGYGFSSKEEGLAHAVR